MSSAVGQRLGWDPAWLWLWPWPAAAALIRLLAWEFPNVVGAALKKKKVLNPPDRTASGSAICAASQAPMMGGPPLPQPSVGLVSVVTT